MNTFSFRFFLLCLHTALICPGLMGGESKPLISTVANNGMPRNIVPCKSDWNFGPGSLWTHKGWQYAAYWDEEKQVSVARRQLPKGAWQVASLPGYQRTESGDRGKGGHISRGFGDGHEKVALGISPDGVIHLSFDHHLSTLRYQTSLKPVADDPESFSWSAQLFGPVKDNLGGPRITSVTYPSFYTGGEYFFCHMRLGGGSGAANSHLFTYQNGKWLINSEPESQIIDQRWSGGDGTVNAYPYGIKFHKGRMHLAWCWRDTPDQYSSHDICYAYSDDYGETWKNNQDKEIGKRGTNPMTADSPGLTIWEIAPGQRFRNGGSMTVDSEGRVHIITRGLDGRPVHYWRDHLSGKWDSQDVESFATFLTYGQKLQTVFSDGKLYTLKPADRWSWQKVGAVPGSFFENCKAGRDDFRFAHDGWVSVIGQEGRTVRSVDFQLAP